MKILSTLLALSFSFAVFAEPLSYSGRLVNTDGSSVVGPVDLQFDLSYTVTSGVPAVICSIQIDDVVLTNGVFHTKIDYTASQCGGKTVAKVLEDIPTGESIAFQVTDRTNSSSPKVYPYQAVNSVPMAVMAEYAQKLGRSGATTTGQVLTWDGNNWVAGAGTGGSGGGGSGTVTNINTGTGLTGGPITINGTISIANGGVGSVQIADGSIINADVAAGAAIARNKLAAGIPSQILVNDGAGNMTSANGATVTAMLGIPTCLPGTKLMYDGSAGPVYWTCPLDETLDNTKVLKSGDTMTGALAMSGQRITNLATPTATTDAANKAYVDSVSGGVVPPSRGGTGLTATSNSSVLITNPAGNYNFLNCAPGNTIGFDFTLGPRCVNLAAAAAGGNYVQGGNSFGATATIGTLDPNNVSVITNGSPRVTVSSDGDVGIGNANPGSKLDVSGALRLRGSTSGYNGFMAAPVAGSIVWTLPTVDGADGEALVTDGAGVLKWAAVSNDPTVGGDLTGTAGNAQIGSGVVGSTEITDGSIANADISATAAIARAKIANGTFGAVVYNDATTGAMTDIKGTVGNQVLGMNNGNTAPEFKTITAGTGVTVTHGVGTITLATDGAAPTGAATGDLDGSYPNPTVDGIRGVKITAIAPTLAQFLIFDGTDYTPNTLSGAVTMGPTGVTVYNGTVPLNRGGTGVTSLAAGGVVTVNAGANGLVSTSCLATQILGFDASGNAICTAISAINGSSFVQGGNSFAAPAVLGTIDSQPLSFVTNNTAKVSILANGRVGIGNSAPDSILDITSTTSGILIPRMSELQRDAIAATGRTGMQIYNTDTKTIDFHDGVSWKALGISGAGITAITIGTGLSPAGAFTSGGTIAIANDGVTTTQIADGTILNADIAATAAIARTKLANGAAGSIVSNNGSGVLTDIKGTANQVLGMDSTGALPEFKNIVGGAGITVAHTAGNVTINGSVGPAFGFDTGEVVDAGAIPTCLDGEKLHMTLLPVRVLECVDAKSLLLAGGTMAGAINMGTNKITNLGTPTAPADAATMAYVDAKVGGAADNLGDHTATQNIALGTNYISSDAGASEGLTFDTAGRGTFQTLSASTSSNVSMANSSAASGSGTSLAFKSSSVGTGAIGVVVDGTTANNYMTFSVRGSNALTEQMRIAADGKVGIGTVTPTTKLHVAGGLRIGAAAEACSVAGAGSLQYNAGVLELCNGTAWASVGGGGSGLPAADGTEAAPSISFASDSDLGFYRISADRLGIALGTPNGYATYFSSTGLEMGERDISAGRGTVSAFRMVSGSFIADSAGSPAYAFYGDTNTGLFSATTGTISLSTAGAEKLRVDASGMKIFGSGSGHVGFQAAATAGSTTYTWPMSAGTTGYVLTTDGTGGLSWAAASGGGGTPAGANRQVQFNNSGAFGASPNLTLEASDLYTRQTVGGNVNYARVSALGLVEVSTDSSYPYTTTSSSGSRPMTYGGTMLLTNRTGGNSNAALYEMDVRTSGGQSQFAYVGAVARAGAGEYTPDIVFGQSTGTGSYAERMRLDKSGNLGVGVTVPVTKLDVAGSLRIGNGGEGCAAGLAGALRYNSSKLQLCNASAWVDVGGSGGGGLPAADGTQAAPSISFINNSNTGLFNDGGNLGFTANGTRTASMGTSSFNVDTQILVLSNSAASDPDYTFQGDSNTGLFSAGADVLGVSTGGAERLRVTNTATEVKNILRLMGSATGSVSFQAAATAGSTTYTWPMSAGTTGHVLTTDGTGGLSWAAASGGGGLPAADGTPSNPSINFASDPTTGIYHMGGSIGFSTGGTSTVSIGNDGLLYADDGVVAQDYMFSGDVDTGLFHYSTNALALATSGFNRIVINSSGLVSVGGTEIPGSVLTINGPNAANSSMTIPRASTANRPTTGVNGMMRYNTTTNKFEAYQNSAWVDMIGGSGGGLPAADGTPSAPSISFANDSDTGIYTWGLPNTLGFSAGGTEMMSITPGSIYMHGGSFNFGSGYGIRLNNTNQNIETAGSFIAGEGVNGQVRFRELNANGSNYVALRSPDNVAANVVWTLPAADGTSGQVLSTNGSGVLSWATAGGGGLPAPSGTQSAPSINFSTDTDTGFFRNSENVMALAVGGVQRFFVSPSYTSTEALLASGTVTAPRFRNSSAGLQNSVAYGLDGVGMFLPDSFATLAFATNNLERMRITTAGRVAIGNSSPDATLHVTGSSGTTLKIVDGNQGAGKVLTSDANGIATWTTPAASGGGLPAASGTATAPTINFSSSTQTGLYMPTAGTIGYAAAGTSYGYINSGAVSFGGATFSGFDFSATMKYHSISGGSVGAPAFSAGTSSSGMYGSAGDIRIATNGVQRMIFDTAGKVGIGMSPAAEVLEVNGSVKGTSFISTSDRRLKKNIKVVKGLPLIMQLRGVTYDWLSDGKSDMGVIAQEIEKIFPQAVTTSPVDGMKAVKYQALIAPLIEATKDLGHSDIEMKREIASLRQENLELKKMFKEMSQRLNKIESKK